MAIGGLGKVSPLGLQGSGDIDENTSAPRVLVHGISPSTGIDSGGTSVTITGSGFIAGTTATIGGASVTSLVIVSEEVLTCDTPSGTAGARDVVATSSRGSGTLTGGFLYTAGGGGPTLVFASDWSTATGATANAVSDGSAWFNDKGSGGGGSTALEVIASTGLDFPTTNVLRIDLDNSVFWNQTLTDQWALPGIGASIYRRWYWRSGITSSIGEFLHPAQTCSSAGPYCDSGWFNFSSGATYNCEFRFGDSAWPTNRWKVDNGLTRNVTYRIETKTTRLSTTTVNFSARVYDTSDVLVYADSDFGNAQTPATGDLSDVPTLTIADEQSHREWMVGYQGNKNFPSEYYYISGCAVSSTDWCGPWINGEGP